MLLAAMHLLHIKDLKDLSAFFWIGVSIDMQDLKDLKRFFLTRTIAGDRPPRYGETEAASRLTRSGSGDPELQFSAPNLANLVNRVNPEQDYHDYQGHACQDDQVSLIVPLPGLGI